MSTTAKDMRLPDAMRIIAHAIKGSTTDGPHTSAADNDDLMKKVAAMLKTEDGRARLRALLDDEDEEHGEVTANASRAPLRPPTVLLGKPAARRASVHANGCRCEACGSESQQQRARAGSDDAPMRLRGLLAGARR